MTEEEFKAVLAVEGRELRLLVRSGFATADNYYVARIVQPILPGDTQEGPYRYAGMERTIFEIASDSSQQHALDMLIKAYSEGRYRK